MNSSSFAIIDSEGTFLRNNDKNKKLVIHEVSIVVFVNNKYEMCYTRQLNYDLRFIDAQTHKDIMSIPRRFRAPYRHKRLRYNKESPTTARQIILDIIDKYKCDVYAKGPQMEESWLYHPELCNRWNESTKINLLHIRELADYGVMKYDEISKDYKTEIIQKVDWKSIDHNFTNSELDELLSTSDVESIHYSFFECFVFGYIFLGISTR
jgi:hypothetical protein